jgi:membrane protein
VERLGARLVALVEPVVERLLGVPRIGMAHAVYHRFASVGGPVLARGLAFVALFALVPALLVILAVVGILVGDPALRDRISAILAAQIPPLEAVIDEALAGFSGLAAPTGIVGLVLLVWSASGLVRAFDGAFRLVFEDDGAGRTPLRDVAAVAAVAGGTFAAAVVLVVVTVPGPLVDVVGVPGPAVRTVASFGAVAALVALAYRFVPRPRPGWQRLALPAVVTGAAIFALTALFGIVGPLLFGSAAVYGAFGALFLGLVWLGNVTQVLLLGAAWVAEREHRARAASRSAADAPER